MNFLDRLKGLSTLWIAFIAVLLGMLVGALMMLLSGFSPIIGYMALFDGIFGSLYDFGETVREIIPLIFTGLAVAFAFRTGLFNIGVEGQFIMGQLAAVYVGIAYDLPWYIHAPFAVLAGAMAGGLWAALPGFLKARLHVHEVITTIMLNYIALILANFLIRTYLKGPSERSLDVLPSARLIWEPLSALFDDSRIHLGIFLGLIMAVVFYLILWRTTLGFELRSVGLNPHAAEYGGIPVQRSIITSMVIAGGFAGIGGASEALGVYGYMAINAAFSGVGFNGIAVALLGANHPVGVVLAAALFGGLRYGSTNMQHEADIPTEVITIVIAVIIFFVAAHVAIQWVLDRFQKGRKGVKA
jgi:ABC-type uncharacterized transport system permease subunit